MKRFLKSAIKNSFRSVGLEVRRRNAKDDDIGSGVTNKVIPEIWEKPVYKKLIRSKARSLRRPIVLLGGTEEIDYLKSAFDGPGRDVTGIVWDWDEELRWGELPNDSRVILCKVPRNDHQWNVVKKLKERYAYRIVGIQELVLPFTTIELAQSSLGYFLEGLEEITPYYIGERYFGPIDELNEALPLAGRSVIEFGPLDGAQTAGLVQTGVKSVTCVEARAENVVKTLVARYAFGWDNVNVVMDDFHNVDDLKYGNYDLAFAHGVYYHSIAPFLFLENLLSLSNNVFVGGYCATDSLPKGDYETLEYRGKRYRVKRYEEADSFLAGVNDFGYFFHGDDLVKFFEERNREVTMISDEESEVNAGKYLRFLASNGEKKTSLS